MRQRLSVGDWGILIGYAVIVGGGVGAGLGWWYRGYVGVAVGVGWGLAGAVVGELTGYLIWCCPTGLRLSKRRQYGSVAREYGFRASLRGFFACGYYAGTLMRALDRMGGRVTFLVNDEIPTEKTFIREGDIITYYVDPRNITPDLRQFLDICCVRLKSEDSS